jgi:uncharacterized membrane protein YfcA
VVGTWVGGSLRRRIPEATFRRVVSGVILAIAVLLLLQARWGG